MKYINLILNNEIRYKNIKKRDLVKQLQQKGLTPMSKITKILSTKINQKDLPDKDVKSSYF